MIVKWFLQAVAALLSFVASLIPDGSVPTWFTGFTSSLGSWLETAGTVGTWVPFSLALTVFAAILAAVVIGFTIRLVRVIASFLTAGGGAAG